MAISRPVAVVNDKTTLMKTVLLLVLLFSPIAPAVSAEDWGAYQNRPLDLRDLVPPDGRRFSLPHEFNYLDAKKQLWEAPSGLIVDGASIPMPFWSVIGGPFSGPYREASVVHDAGCCAKTRPWQEVHRMFYEAMRCSGVGWVKAKTMYLAVWAMGPRWTKLNSSMPKDCLLAAPSGTPPAMQSFMLPTTDIAQQVVQEIKERQITLPEARAVARPFFNRSAMSDKDATQFAAELKGRDLSAAERAAISLSVLQSEWVSEEEVRGLEQWVERENPALEKVEARAEELRSRRITELRLFPKVEALRQSIQERNGQLP